MNVALLNDLQLTEGYRRMVVMSSCFSQLQQMNTGSSWLRDAQAAGQRACTYAIIAGALSGNSLQLKEKETLLRSALI